MYKIVTDWKLSEGKRFRELIVYCYNYSTEEVRKYGLDDFKPFKKVYTLKYQKSD